MPTHVQFIRATDFVLATPEGQLDLERSEKLLTSLASASELLVAHEVLLDMRGAQVALSATDLWKLAAAISRRHTTFPGRVAVLCLPNRVGRAEFFALCAQNRGFPVGAFTTFEGAVEWLSADAPRFREDID